MGRLSRNPRQQYASSFLSASLRLCGEPTLRGVRLRAEDRAEFPADPGQAAFRPVRAGALPDRADLRVLGDGAVRRQDGHSVQHRRGDDHPITGVAVNRWQLCGQDCDLTVHGDLAHAVKRQGLRVSLPRRNGQRQLALPMLEGNLKRRDRG